MTTAYPLAWPETFPRTKIPGKSQFRTTLSGAMKNVDVSLRAFGRESRVPLTQIVISSNVSLGNDKPKDSGVAVWFMWEGKQVCIPVDRYLKVEENLQAIHHVLEARRVELRHGTLSLVRATMQGFLALPPTASWRTVLGFVEGEPPTKEKVERAFKHFAQLRHPDKGGTADDMAKLNLARTAALAELNGGHRP